MKSRTVLVLLVVSIAMNIASCARLPKQEHSTIYKSADKSKFE